MSRRRGSRTTKKAQHGPPPEYLFDDPMTVSASDFPAGEPDFEVEDGFDDDIDDGSYESVVWDEGADLRHLMRMAPRQPRRSFANHDDWD